MGRVGGAWGVGLGLQRAQAPAAHGRAQPLAPDAVALAAQFGPQPTRPIAAFVYPKRLYKWQKEALTPVAAARGAELDPATAAELRQLRAANRRQAQELDILKKAIAIFSQTPDQ